MAFVAAIGAVGLAGQSVLPQPSSFQHVTVKLGASAPDVAPGGTVSVWVEATPKANIHVYAAGAKDVEPVKLVVSPNRYVTAGHAVFPAPTLTVLPGTSQRVPVYNSTFRVTQPLSVQKDVAAGGALVISATLNYQACDDKVCYPPASLPVFWRIGVKK